jgi:hypothetical protein
VSAQQLVAFCSLQEQRSHEALELRMLPLEMGLFSGVLMDLKGRVRMDQELVPPLIIQGLAALVLMTELRHRLALPALQHDPGFGLGIPLASWHG